jgi:TonB family protein
MTMTTRQRDERACARVELELSRLVEGEASELTRHLDACGACAALVARSTALARELAGLGDGLALPDDLARRVLERADGAAPRRGRRRARLARVALAASLLAGLVAGGAWLERARRARQAPTSAAPAPTFVLVGLETASGRPDTAHLLEAGRWRALAGGRPLAVGARIRSGEATRLRLRAGDGIELALNRGAELVVLPDGVRLERGELLCERARKGPAYRIVVPTGEVLVVGTRLHVASAPGLALVEVLRGEVRLVTGAGSATAAAGEEGVLAAGRAPRVALAADLGRAAAWAERAGEEVRENEPVPVGVGSLRGQRPGRSESLALELEEHGVTARVQGALARTEVRETFRNPTGDTLEGIYRFPLPAGARISRLALVVDGRLEEGAIEERGRAGKIWRGVIRQGTPVALRRPDEEYVWVPGPWRDPALLEWRAGNQFELRIYPIPARGSRTVILAYTETLPRTARGRRYVYPLAATGNGRAAARDFRFSLELSGHDPSAPLFMPHYPLARSGKGSAERLAFAARDFVPAGDLVVDFATTEHDARLALRSQPGGAGEAGYLLFALRPELPVYRSQRPRAFAIVVDRSYSTIGEAGRRQLRLLAALLEGLGGDDAIALAACDASCRTILPWQRAREGGAAGPRALGRVAPGGATDLSEAIRGAASLLASAPPGAGGSAREPRVLYLGDGVPTVGELETSRLVALVTRELAARGAQLTTIGVGTSIDASLLEALARAGGGGYVPYLPGTSASGQALAALARQRGPVLEEARLELPAGIREVYPRRLPNLVAGEELLVAARAEGPVRGELTLRGRVNGEPYEARHRVEATGAAGAEGSFLPRLWAQLAIDELSLDEGEAARAETIALSKRHHLLSRHTSLIVLESEAMRRAFGVAAGPRPEESPDTQVPGHGRLGTLGASGTGTGSGYGVGLRGLGRGGGAGRATSGGSLGHDAADDPLDGLVDGAVGSRPGSTTPPPVLGRAAVSGSLDKSIIQRVIRRELGSIRNAYERALKRDPRASGRIVVQFTIGPSGQVIACRATGSDDAQLSRDLEAAILRWRFPAPAGGGQIIVSYPFVFKTSGGDVDGAASPPPPRLGLPDPGRGPGRWVRMRRVWFTEASLALGAGDDRALLARRRGELEARPDSRDRHRRLLQALAWAGEGAEARRLAEAWLARDPHASEALRHLAEALARLGEREEALRVLGSLVELEPRDVRLHARLAEVLRDAGRPRLACAHRLALASLSPVDAGARQAAEACRAGLLPAEPGARWIGGPVTLRASWRGGDDLDLALVDGRGRRYAWLSPARVRASDATRAGREALGLALPPGRYRIEVSHAAGAAPSEPVVGAIELRAPGLERRLPFLLRGARAYLGELRLERKSRLEQP